MKVRLGIVCGRPSIKSCPTSRKSLKWKERNHRLRLLLLELEVRVNKPLFKGAFASLSVLKMQTTSPLFKFSLKNKRKKKPNLS
jgi:hypothetical protein